ncbi:hypothetical protein ATR01nite_15870 [Acetobacter tropicalis]|uniref:Uncharacterized protein n=1 Tax=Acetobacter tropicalis TaxID=104102 RepID=A0A511FNJ0_9PROT|nr:hypothetical protein ATR01nite_15870 [Acetobacter tropicalis]
MTFAAVGRFFCILKTHNRHMSEADASASDDDLRSIVDGHTEDELPQVCGDVFYLN